MENSSIVPDASNSITNTTVSHTTDLLIYSYGERVFVAICWLLITIFGTLGNSLVIVAVLLSRKLRTDTNVFVVSLAVADLLTSLFLFWSVFALLGRNGWPLPQAEWLCVAGGFMIFACTGVSLWNLVAISLNRLLLITLPLSTYRMIYKPCNIAIMVTMVWLIPGLVCLVLPLAGIGGFGYDQQHSTCSDLDLHPQGETFHLAQTITFYPIPLITIITCYAFIFHRVRRHFKQQRNTEELKTSAGTSVATSSSGVSSGSASGQGSTPDLEAAVVKETPEKTPSNRTQRINKMEMDITKNLFLVVCVFFLFFTPYFVALFIPGSDYFLLYGGIIVLANSMMNPIIYARRHPRFKVVFSCMISRRYGDIPEPSDFLKRLLRKRGR
ncbi:G-protein coupled receptor moody-like [Amphiura filiformis]|uniref:G-protein coupled receptor moody-like n=1 Tax=Amphiura filiformis TaxID=82378 RepID=UPI003B22260B